MFEFLIPVSLFISIAAIVILRGPLGKAIADRLAGRVGGAPGLPDDQVAGELDELRRRLTDLEERVDFSERLLARGRDGARSRTGG